MIGYKSIRYNNIVWRTLPYGLAPLSSPQNLQNKINYIYAAELLKRFRDVHFVRWEVDFDLLSNSPWWHIIKDCSSPTELDSHSRNTRSKIRRGLKSFTYEIGTISDILDSYNVYSVTFDSYDTFENKYSNDQFAKILKSLPDDSEFWIIRDIGTSSIVGFCENYKDTTYCFYNSIWIIPEAQRKYASYGLFFKMNHHYLRTCSLQFVSDGTRNISHNTRIHEFLTSHFGFRKAFSRLNLKYSCWLLILVKSLYPFRMLLRHIPANAFIKLSLLLRMEEISRLSQKM